MQITLEMIQSVVSRSKALPDVGNKDCLDRPWFPVPSEAAAIICPCSVAPEARPRFAGWADEELANHVADGSVEPVNWESLGLTDRHGRVIAVVYLCQCLKCGRIFYAAE